MNKLSEEEKRKIEDNRLAVALKKNKKRLKKQNIEEDWGLFDKETDD